MLRKLTIRHANLEASSRIVLAVAGLLDQPVLTQAKVTVSVGIGPTLNGIEHVSVSVGLHVGRRPLDRTAEVRILLPLLVLGLKERGVVVTKNVLEDAALTHSGDAERVLSLSYRNQYLDYLAAL